MNEELRERLKKLEIEDVFWVVFIGLVVLSLYANGVERKFLIDKDEKSREEYRHLLIFIFSVAVIIYLYYVWDGYQDFIHLTDQDTATKKEYAKLSLVASIFILVGGIIFLYIAICDTELEAEIAL